MALTASTLITSAKERTFGAQGRQKISMPMLLGELTHQDQLVVQMLSQIAPDLLATVTGVVVTSDNGNLNGYTLQNGMHYRDFVHGDVTDGVYTPINMLQRKHRDSNPPSPAGMLRTGGGAAVFHPIDPVGKRWLGGDTRSWYDPALLHEVTYSYIATPPVLTALADTLASPDMSREIFVSALVVRILLSQPKGQGDELEAWQVRVQAAITALQSAQSSFQMQAYKFMQAQGNPGGGGVDESESAWVSREVTN